ncbi:hypothetical protein QUB08_31940 [Microcoleus sp. BR0-C5]|uniref:hypothetical protein n=1 Tax=Microcoleus sp. BR0-C5 TaxID=2818713 RepID=UPI002FD736CE
MILSEPVKLTFKDAAKKLTGYRRRDFMAKVAEDYFNAWARQVETFMGWNRDSVQLGLHERRTGLICVDNYRARGRHKSEILLPNLEADIRSVVEPESQANPKFQSTFLYAKITAKAVVSALVSHHNYKIEELPSRQTIGTILNRMGYRLKKHKKPSR